MGVDEPASVIAARQLAHEAHETRASRGRRGHRDGGRLAAARSALLRDRQHSAQVPVSAGHQG